GAAVFGECRFLLGARPAEDATFVNRMQRVDEHEGARQWQTASHFSLTKTGEDCGFPLPRQPRLGDPCGKFRKVRIVHAVASISRAHAPVLREADGRRPRSRINKTETPE